MKELKGTKGIVYGLLFALVISGFVFMNSKNVVADEEKEVKLVSVQGIGIVSAEPDMAYINIGVETENDDIGKAQSENQSKIDAVMKAIKGLGIKGNKIQTVNYYVDDRTRYIGEGEKREKYYVVRNNMQVQIDDIKKVSKVIDAVSKAGSNQISNIRFDVSNRKELYQKALKLAMKDSKQKATSIMSAFGKKPTEPYRISEGNYSIGEYDSRLENFKVMDGAGIPSTEISSRELRVSATLSVQYDY